MRQERQSDSMLDASVQNVQMDSEEQPEEVSSTAENPRKKALWSLLFIAIAALTVWAVVSQGHAFTPGAFAEYVSGMSLPWLLAAVGAMLCHIFFEGEALRCVCQGFQQKAGHARSFAWAASDLYFSAITPSATGGQPACAWFMIRDGVPPVVTTVALLVNLVMYTLSILVMGSITLITQPQLFAGFRPLAKVLIVVGCFAQVGLATLLVLLVMRREFLHRICRKGLKLLSRLHLLKHEEETQHKLAVLMDEYRRCSEFISGHKKTLVKVFLCNLVQRGCLIAVPMFVYLAGGGPLALAGRAWALQCYAVLGSNTVPIPGAMGVSDYLMLDGFGELLGVQSVTNFELLSRSLSFYACVLLCGAITLVKYILAKKKRRAS